MPVTLAGQLKQAGTPPSSSRTRKPRNQGAGHSDDMQTPASALEPLYPFLPHGCTIWEPAAGKGNLIHAFEARGHSVIASDVRTGQDFLTWEPVKPWDVIVTNPPYSIKDAFLARAYELLRPFAFLLPLTALESRKRQALYRAHGLEMILFPNRVDFETPSGTGSGAWFQCAWFTHGLGIGRQMTFWQPESAQASLFAALPGPAEEARRRSGVGPE